jgi:hypothetical protein
VIFCLVVCVLGVKQCTAPGRPLILQLVHFCRTGLS